MIGLRLKKLREENNISQEQLANKLNVSASSIGMYETDKREPSDEIKTKIAKIFDVSIDYLVGKSDIKNPEIKEDPLGLAKIGFNMKDYNPPTETQKEQIKSVIEVIMKDNKKDK